MNPLNPEDIQDLKHLIEFLKENQVAEFDLDRGELKVRLKFAQPEAPARIAAVPGMAVEAVAQPVVPALGAAAPVVPAAPVADPDAGLHIIKSPIVGTFYGSSSPGVEPFVSVGSHVVKGKVVCIIEAMKLMNEIEADASGEVVKCFAFNGQPVEFGQPLFAIRPA